MGDYSHETSTVQWHIYEINIQVPAFVVQTRTKALILSNYKASDKMSAWGVILRPPHRGFSRVDNEINSIDSRRKIRT